MTRMIASPHRRTVLGGAAAITLAGLTLPLSAVRAAEQWPSRPIRLVVPTAPGGPLDVLGRLVARSLGAALGQNVIVENRPGAALNIGTASVVRADPDGYTMLIANDGPLAINVSLYSNMGYDPRHDLAPIGMLATLPLVAVVNPTLPVRSLGELVAHAKAHPGKLNYAYGGSISQLAAELFKQTTGADIAGIAYRGSGPAVTSLITGETQVMFDGLTSSLGQIQADKLRALAVTGAQRSGLMPNVPTVSEAGFPGLAGGAWFAMLAPKATDPAIIARVHAELARTVASPEFVERLQGLGLQPTTSTPEELSAHIAREVEKWAQVVREAGIKPDPL